MKKYAACMLILLSACGEQTPRENAEKIIGAATEVANTTTDTMCFVRTEGNEHQDTAAIKLVITGNYVSGKMMYLPAEKDWRLGNLKGIRQNNILKLTWVYMQEGIKDSTTVMLKLEKGKVFQKPYSYDESGNAFIADTSQYRIEYQRTDCAYFPQYDFDLGID